MVSLSCNFKHNEHSHANTRIRDKHNVRQTKIQSVGANDYMGVPRISIISEHITIKKDMSAIWLYCLQEGVLSENNNKLLFRKYIKRGRGDLLFQS